VALYLGTNPGFCPVYSSIPQLPYLLGVPVDEK
jgi:hypothetical protein